MKFSCSIADDLLPLYLEDACSEDSKAALEEHLQGCPACREKLARMRNSDIIPQMKQQERPPLITGFTKKIRRRRICTGIFIALLTVLGACILALYFLTIDDMRRIADPAVYDVEEGVYNLTAADLETTAAEVGEYILYTNSKRIQVTIQKDTGFDGEIILWNATNREEPKDILYGHADAGNNTCVFTNLSASQRYMVTCGGDEQIAVTISDGRVVSFRSSLMNVLEGIFR